MNLDTAIGKTVAAVLTNAQLKKATCVLTPTLVVTATYRGKRDRRNTRSEIALTVGAPNFAARELIKLAKRAGEPFPIRKLQFQLK